MSNKLNATRLQYNLNQAHDEITSALSYLSEVVIACEPGAARTGLNEIHEQFAQLYAQTRSIKRLITAWTTMFPELTEPQGPSFGPDAHEYFDFDAELDAYDADDEDDDEDDRDFLGLDGGVSNEGSSAADDTHAAATDFDMLRDGHDILPPLGASLNDDGYTISDADIGRLFDISAASAGAGVNETGYLDIFGAWIHGRRPGPYKRPQPPADSDPDYNVPGTDE
jgi:hypothetical protein